jgi:hypothetical protein
MPNFTDPSRTTSVQGYHFLKPLIDNTKPGLPVPVAAEADETPASTPDVVIDKAE